MHDPYEQLKQLIATKKLSKADAYDTILKLITKIESIELAVLSEGNKGDLNTRMTIFLNKNLDTLNALLKS